jgi:hypothetical protein
MGIITTSATATTCVSVIFMIIEVLGCLHEYYIVLFFKLFPEVFFEASIVHARDIMLIIFIYIYDLVFHVLG